MRHSSPERVIPQAGHWLASLLVASLCFFVCLDTASAQFKTQTYDQKERGQRHFGGDYRLGAFLHLRSLY